MDSNDLKELGFCQWQTFQKGLEILAPESKGVYAFRSPKMEALVRGFSDIVYIGRAMSDKKGPYHNIRHSIREYLHPGKSQRTKQRVGIKASEQQWHVSWLITHMPDQLECQILRHFYSEHDQLPAENKKWPPGCQPMLEA